MPIQNGEQLLEMMRGYQVSCVLAAAVDLSLFEHLAGDGAEANQVSEAAGCDLRAVTIVLGGDEPDSQAGVLGLEAFQISNQVRIVVESGESLLKTLYQGDGLVLERWNGLHIADCRDSGYLQ